MSANVHGPWPNVLLDSVAMRGSGHTPSRKHPDYWDGDVKWVSLKDTARLDNGLINTTGVTITESGLAHSAAVVHPRGSVILLRDAGIGKSAVLASDMAVSQHFMAWRCGPKLHNWFLYYVLQFRKPEFERIANGSTIKTIGLDYFRQLQIALPDLPEQRSIAGVLSAVDAAIAMTERLIAKKRAIKHGVMQELLSGRTRLPGFSECWTPARFGAIAAPARERVRPQTVTGRVVELEHLAAGTGALLGDGDVRNAVSLKTRFRDGDVLFGKLRAYLRKYWLADRDGYSSTEIWALRPRDGVASGKFVRYVVEQDGFIEAASTAYGTHMPRSDWGIVSKFRVLLPPPSEQIAIGEVLGDADAEIEALERRLDVTRALKVGMMQELLTGRARLSVGEDAE
ncbi:restriction endonuclease subunit S [Antribacter sp. KLBMP9083]|uniref:Restriction endonuclease subunit S n=1 Tax=Antribacter soli TaxID=2910976 RepID=A0AA41QG29_9MICO|nr:restriction endonuclease subunit S [Antribacter soli]MCF4122001.1 restriction endonuclease subunit S [Antribacter soli]